MTEVKESFPVIAVDCRVFPVVMVRLLVAVVIPLVVTETELIAMATGSAGLDSDDSSE